MAEVGRDEIRSVWHQLAEEIIPTILSMKNRNSKVREDTKDVSILTPNEASVIATTSDEKNNIEIERPELPEEVKIEEAKNQLFADN